MLHTEGVDYCLDVAMVRCSSCHAAHCLHVPADTKTYQLVNVKEVLELLGYTPTSNPADANIIWAWRDPFTRQDEESEPKLAAVYDYLPSMQQFQFLNHHPGLGHLATKPELAKLSSQLSVVPRTFSLPGEYQAWQEFIKTEQGAQMEWIQKGTDHRYDTG
jgi:hypothetical protein